LSSLPVLPVFPYTTLFRSHSWKVFCCLGHYRSSHLLFITEWLSISWKLHYDFVGNCDVRNGINIRTCGFQTCTEKPCTCHHWSDSSVCCDATYSAWDSIYS